MTTVSTEEARAFRAEMRAALWRRGDLRWKLDFGKPRGPQRDFYEASKASERKTFVSEDARRLGKSWALAIVATELALKNPGARINWCQGTTKGVLSSAVKTFAKVCRDAPPECKGELRNGAFVFPNGAYVFIFGGHTEVDADAARGGDDPIASFFDEAGFIRWLKYIYSSIVKPGMRRVERRGHYGMIFVSSSTPKDLEHFFLVLADLSERLHSYVKRNIYEADDPERYIAEEAAEAGLTIEQFLKTDTFRRELMCERIVDKDAVVFPEFSEVQAEIVMEWPRPLGFARYLHKRVSVDPGMSDKTGLLFAYADFTAGKIIIEDEELLTRPNTAQIAAAVRAKEAELWPDADEKRTERVIDDPHGRMVLDLWELQHLRFAMAVKHDRDTSIGIVRTHLLARRIIIHPRCIRLRQQLLNATKTRSGKDFDRNEEGHFDLASAAMYLVRGFDMTRNPLPADFDKLTGRAMPDTHPIMMRREQMGRPREMRGLAGAILSGNVYVQNQLARRRR